MRGMPRLRKTTNGPSLMSSELRDTNWHHSRNAADLWYWEPKRKNNWVGNRSHLVSGKKERGSTGNLRNRFPDRLREREKQRMPMRDHFRPPLDDLRHWEGFHATWPVMIVAQLRRKLPRRYFAEPRVHSGASAE